MQIFVYEYTCGDAATHPRVAALQAEGWAMLSAFLEDFGRIPGVQTLTLLDEHCSYQAHAGICRRIPPSDQEHAFRELATTADYTLVIAPEFDDLLLTRCRWV